MSAARALRQELRQAGRIVAAIELVWGAGWWWATGHTALLVAQCVFPLVYLYVLRLIIDTVSRAASQPAASDFAPIAWLIVLVSVAAIVDTVIRGAARLVSEGQEHVVADHVYDLLHAKSITVDFAYYEHPKYYDALHRAQQEASLRSTHLVTSLTQVIRSGLTLFVILAVLVSFHWLVAVLMVVWVVPSILARTQLGSLLHRWQNERTPLERHAAYLSSVLTSTEPAKEVRLFDLGEVLAERFRRTREMLRRERLAIVARRSIVEIITQSSAEIAMFASLGVVAFQTLQGAFTVGGLVTCLGALQWSRSLLNEFLAGLVSLHEDNLFLSNLFAFLALEQGVLEPVRPVAMPRPMRSGISFEHVHFRYPDSERDALDDVSFHIAAGEKVALVGENGSGKTTLVKLLCRLYDPTSGSISVDGTPLTDFRTTDLRREISAVFQDYVRYELLAKENIQVGNIHGPLDEQRVRAAASLTGADDVIARLPAGYDTMLGKRFAGGEELSVGEWQKVALARAFMRESQIIILDEPTSALDAEAEYHLFRRFYQLAEGRTAILISHRLSTVKMADRIYVLEHGRIAESGTHDALMQHRARYARLFDLQAQPYR